MDPTEDEITARIQQMASDGEIQPTVDQAPHTDYLSGALQGALAMGTTYLSRRIDIDIANRIGGGQPDGTRLSNQRPNFDHLGLTSSSGAGFQLGGLVLPALVLIAGAWFIFKKG